ncbi:hypothetical protein HKX48_003857 [Thoreauomyces humboldtii]|nr:hypothetical protein HKX48_003857 [Thoreauomyces humboldtii]
MARKTRRRRSKKSPPRDPNQEIHPHDNRQRIHEDGDADEEKAGVVVRLMEELQEAVKDEELVASPAELGTEGREAQGIADGDQGTGAMPGPVQPIFELTSNTSHISSI